MVKKYKKKPEFVEAVQYNGDLGNIFQIAGFVEKCSFLNGKVVFEKTGASICTSQNAHMPISVGDYIVINSFKEIAVCHPDVFEATYEEEKQ